MNGKWIFKDGISITECTSFPYAYRALFNALKKGVEKSGRKYEDMIREMKIVSPIKDRYGNTRTYSYAEATQMATDQGLLINGQISSKEFKRR